MSDDLTRAYTPQPTPPAGGPDLADPTPGIRGGLGRLSTGLIAYGVVGLIVCAIGLGAIVWINGRVDALADRVDTSVESLATTIERTAQALEDASSTADSFTGTLDTTAEAVTAAAATIKGVRSNLETLEGVLRAVNILGVSPLGPAGDAVGGIANAIEGLDTRLSAVGDDLGSNRDALAANADSLGKLADSTAAAAARLRSGVVEASLDDVQAVLVVVLLVFTAWSAVPAAGAIVFGVWLRRELARPS